jgi:YjbE family integral membrane protein
MPLTEQLLLPAFWLAVGQIIMIDILLGGDNAVVIAMACRGLPDYQRIQGIVWGTLGAILMRVVLIFFALHILAIPYLKIVGAVLLIWIGVRLVLPQDKGSGHAHVGSTEQLGTAIRTVITADLVMSIDNVLAIAAAAESAAIQHKMPIVVFGLLVSIPIIVVGSRLALRLMDRYPIVVTAGGLLLGWISGVMLATDAGIAWMVPQNAIARYICGAVGAVSVVMLGRLAAARASRAAHDTEPGEYG